MLSIISIYNDTEVLEARLLESLRRQEGACYETITVDNRGGQYDSAAAALNYGARQATGEWLIFVHQDVSLISNAWLAAAERMLKEFQPGGWTGVAGMTAEGAFRGLLRDRACLLGAPFGEFGDVQTLDECLLIRRRQADDAPYFDEELTGWHAYGVEACCRALREGETNYVIALPVWHDSRSTNLARLDEAHQYVWRKHQELKRIYTTCGALPDSYAPENERAPHEMSVDKWITDKLYRACGVRTRRVNLFGEFLEALTEGERSVEVLRARAELDPIKAESFVAQPKRAGRRIVHRFLGLTCDEQRAECVVVMPEVSTKLLSDGELEKLMKRSRRLLICLNADELWRHPAQMFSILQRATGRYVMRKADAPLNWDGMPSSIIAAEING
ncbi:MAG: glycosyltransferase [Pyrinomonadaceae bacterium]